LSTASFLLANLSGVNLTDVILEGTNFWKTDLSGVDFTVTSTNHGIIFIDANLSNSNFEGVTLSPTQVFTIHSENARAKIEGVTYHPLEFMIKLLGNGYVEDVGYIGLDNIDIISTEISGNDLVVKFVFFNNFARANLENANFKNADLLLVNFHSANLTNADLSGADLRNALLNHADLSNANLQGADLSGADLSGADLSGADLSSAALSGVVYDQYTILKCVGHPICV
jgi:uncharacterized protein YjbI with pentapeptide repeats